MEKAFQIRLRVHLIFDILADTDESSRRLTVNWPPFLRSRNFQQLERALAGRTKKNRALR